MSSARFAMQALLVLALIALVGLPEQRKLRAGDFWQGRRFAAGRTAGDDEGDARRVGFRGVRALVGYGSARDVFGANDPLNRKLYENDIEGRRKRIAEGVLTLGGKLNAILGYTRTALNSPIPFARVSLRDLLTGKIEARGIADEKGQFTFLDVTPSGYIVELMDANGNIVATSELIQIAAGDLRETTVRMPGRRGSQFGAGLNATAPEAVAAAAGEGVNRVAAPERCASPPCNNGTS